MRKKLWQDQQIAAFSSLGLEAGDFLKALAEARQPIKRNISRLLCLRDENGTESVIQAI
jgi:hypothetical protein